MIITKKCPLSMLRHLRVINSEFLKQRFDGCLFQVSFYQYNFFSLFTIYYIKVYSIQIDRQIDRYTYTHTCVRVCLYIFMSSINPKSIIERNFVSVALKYYKENKVQCFKEQFQTVLYQYGSYRVAIRNSSTVRGM